MKVLVLGAGVIGVTTAYYLNEAGHEVTVLDLLFHTGAEAPHAHRSRELRRIASARTVS